MEEKGYLYIKTTAETAVQKKRKTTVNSHSIVK